MLVASLPLALLTVLSDPPLPVIEVLTDNVRIDRSCVLTVPRGTVIRDLDANGVVQVVADGVRIEFSPGSVLSGANAETPGDELEGLGIRVDGHTGVTIANAAIRGFRCGVYATRADGLVVDNGTFQNIRMHRLKSTPQAEDAGDWLWPHRNDANEWLVNYGAAVYVEDSTQVTLRGNRVRQSQNGLVIDRVDDAKIYDNDASFLSGWGLAMWRSSRNMISRNALDFCVRGYSHSVYNRGQDSAGILCFEQCNENVFIENSVTHGGDGFFGFAGREALGEGDVAKPGLDHTNRGVNGNLFLRNDLSYAPAHGLELTFSFDNWVIDNRIVENAICGIWGGYSQRMYVYGNEFSHNGKPGAWEGGGINSEYAYSCVYKDNRFLANSTAIGIWCRKNEGLQALPWAQANHKGCGENLAVGNSFDGDAIAFRMNDAGTVRTHGNSLSQTKNELKGSSTLDTLTQPPAVPARPDIPEAIGTARPVGARATLRGRDKIVMGEWGPWDHESVMMRFGGRLNDGVELQVFGAPQKPTVSMLEAYTGQPRDHIQFEVVDGPIPGAHIIRLRAAKSGVAAYAAHISAGNVQQTFRGTIVAATWNASFFTWTDETDPRKNLQIWRDLAAEPQATRVELASLQLAYGHGGPQDHPLLRAQKDRLPANNRFGMVATSRLELPKGQWTFATLSDDGVRVSVNGTTVLENWTWHAPTKDSAVFTQTADGMVEIVVEHFEIDGFATLDLSITPAN